MTGFGRGEATNNGITVTTEVKSVNSRYLDISFRLPQVIQDKELELKEEIQKQLSRGKLNINVRLDQAETGEPDITFSDKLAKGYKQLLEELRSAAHISEPVTLRDLLQFGEIFVSREQDQETLNIIWELSKEATQKALKQLISMRVQEGNQIKEDLLNRVDHISQVLSRIEELTRDRAPEIRDKLMERIQNLIDDDSLDPDRLEMEVAMLADKMDITEEIVRLKSHIKFFKHAVDQEETVGRRLNFLSQEMNREINTIGSKASSSEISQYVVQAKESLEQIREQVQNVE